MLWPLLGSLFFLFIFTTLLVLTLLILKPKNFIHYQQKFIKTYFILLFFYGIFILFFTGPKDLSEYPTQENAQYSLPWKAGVTRLVSQGNYSFTSHRGLHAFAWDFLMKNGTPVLASRDGIVLEVVEQFNGIGLKSNVVLIQHVDGEISGYAHIKKGSSYVKIGEHVLAGQKIALSGMVGQTIYPHLHFFVLNESQTESIPIAFKDVVDVVPLAGRFYKSNNIRVNKVR